MDSFSRPFWKLRCGAWHVAEGEEVELRCSGEGVFSERGWGAAHEDGV